MASIAKPVLLAVIAILAVVLFLQTSNFITGMVLGNETSPASVSGTVTTQNTAPAVYNISCLAWTQTPTACVNDTNPAICTINVHDNDGWLNVSSVQGWLKSGAGKCASQNENNCRINASCTNITNINITDEIWQCSFGVITFFADNGTWTATMNATDATASGAETSTSLTRSDLDAIDIQSSTINWGSLAVGSSNQQTNVAVNCGNIEQDINVNGTQMGCSIRGSIAAGNITTGISTGPTQQLSGSYYKLETDTSVATASATNSTKTTYWNLTVPVGASGTCTGTIHFVAVKNQTVS